MIYGNLTLRDRLVRAAIGAVLGAALATVLVFRMDMRSGKSQAPTWLLPGVLVGAVTGGALAFRRKRI